MTEGNYSNVGHRGPVYKGLGAMNPCDNLRQDGRKKSRRRKCMKLERNKGKMLSGRKENWKWKKEGRKK
jgi:hypothetical protein